MSLPLLSPDLNQAASHLHLVQHLSGPFSAGAVNTEIAITPAGRAVVDWNSREPLLLVAPRQPQAGTSLRLTAVLNPDGAAASLAALTFSAYSEAGASLPLHLPPVDANTRTAAPFTLALTLAEVAPDGTSTAIPAAQLASRLVLYLLEGVFGRMLYVMNAEKARLRQQLREISAMRMVETARDSALDNLGADLGVPRFAETLAFQATASGGEIVTQTRREPDDEYRLRLSLARRFVLPSRPQIDALLNGPGGSGDPNRGLLSRLGVTARFGLVEEDNPFAVAIHLVNASPGSYRSNFLEYIRLNHLLWPANSAAANQVHRDRFWPAEYKTRIDQLRTRIRQNYSYPTNAAIAPQLAVALDRLGRCRRALGVTTQWTILRAQSSTAGSRYELGLGVDLDPLTPAQLTAMAAAHANPSRPANPDPEIEALLRSMHPRPASADPDGRWLIEPCGLRTVHRVDTTHLYVSHFPTFGLVIDGPTSGPASVPVDLEARYHAPGDPGKNAALLASLAAAVTAWAAHGGTAWTELSDAAALLRWNQAGVRPAGDPAFPVLQAAGLPAVQNQPSAVNRLTKLPGELIQTIVLDAGLSASILAGSSSAIPELTALVDILQAQGVASVLPLLVPGAVLLVAGAIGLPEAGINLSDRRSTGFRWYAIPLEGPGGAIRTVGSRTAFAPYGPGLTAIVVIGYARRGLTDPYEYRVELPEGELLDLRQYEFLMNLLDRAYPIGVEVNTFSIRKQHVDLDGDEAADPLRPSVSRSYRPYFRRRHRGQPGVQVEDGS